MKKCELIDIFNEIVESFLTRHDFILESRSKILYKRNINDVEQFITCTPRKAKAGGFGMAPGFGIRVPSIVSITHSEDQLTTVGKPLYLLKPNKTYSLWGFDKKQDLLKAQKSIIDEMETYGISFLNKFTSSESIFLSLKSDDPDNWFMCSNDSRDSLIVAFTYIKYGKDEALIVGENFMKNYENQMPKFYKNLSEVIAKIMDKY